MELNLTILVQQTELILCSSSSYLPSLELLQRENQYFFG